MPKKEALKSAEYSYDYALTIIKGRFIKGESVIATNDFYSYLYAREILHGRFEQCEKIILDSNYKDDYIKSLNNLQYLTLINDYPEYNVSN